MLTLMLAVTYMGFIAGFKTALFAVCKTYYPEQFDKRAKILCRLMAIIWPVTFVIFSVVMFYKLFTKD